MKYVIDSNVALKWVLPEPDADKAIQLRDEFRSAIHELLAPDIFPVEVLHALTRAERQKRIPVGSGHKLWRSIMTDAPALHPHIPLLDRAYQIASLARIGIYDCLYVALAEQVACELVTADDKLLRNLHPTFPFIVSLASLP
jgi:predicted nucleic acid-binding protein